jgi:short-subunit dehydrogenase
LYLELKDIASPVRVQALCPGFTYSEFHDVIKMDRSRVHKSLWMTADAVVEYSMRKLGKNRLFVVPGWRYRMFVRLIRFLPLSLRHYIAIKYGDIKN